MERAAIYVRISDDREGRELGVDRQDKDCRTLARRERLKVVDTYPDNDISASTKSHKPRPEYDRLLADARAGKFSVIVAYTSSRLTRRPREHEDLIDLAVEHGITYQFVRSPSFDLNTADGRQIARMLAAADAAESERTAERVAASVLQRAERSKYHGGARGFGLTADGQAIVDEEAELIRAWYAHVLAGGSLHGIRTQLERAGILSVTGKPWRTPVIRKILLNPRNAGIRILDGVEYRASNPPIVLPETWRAAKYVLESPERTTNATGTARKHLGTGLFLCQRCEPQTVNTNYDARGNLVYRCLKCFRAWRAEPINMWIIDLVGRMLAKEDSRERLLPKPHASIDLQGLRTEAAAIQENLAALATEFVLAKGAVRAALTAGVRAGELRLAEIEAELTAAGRVDAATALLAADDPVAAWYDLEDVSRRQAVLRSMMLVRLGAPIRGRARWDAHKFMGASEWINDRRTWGEIWQKGE